MTFPVERLKELNVKITRLVTDSRAVQGGDTFVAYPGETTDGRRFISQAIAQGANAVIWEARHFAWDAAWQVPNLGVTDLRHKAGWLADAVYGMPSEKLWVAGKRFPRRTAGQSQYHAGPDTFAWTAGGSSARWRPSGGDGSVFARAVPGTRQWRAL
jgi:hypothetical protein